MIDEPLHLVAAFITGVAAGALYLSMLWFAVRRLPRVKHGGVWLLSTACLRIGLLLTVCYGIAQYGWEMLLACLLGFLAIRFAATRWAASQGVKRPAAS